MSSLKKVYRRPRDDSPDPREYHYAKNKDPEIPDDVPKLDMHYASAPVKEPKKRRRAGPNTKRNPTTPTMDTMGNTRSEEKMHRKNLMNLSRAKLLKQCSRAHITESLSRNPGKKEMVDQLMNIEFGGKDSSVSKKKSKRALHRAQSDATMLQRPKLKKKNSRRYDEPIGLHFNVNDARVDSIFDILQGFGIGTDQDDEKELSQSTLTDNEPAKTKNKKKKKKRVQRAQTLPAKSWKDSNLSTRGRDRQNTKNKGGAKKLGAQKRSKSKTASSKSKANAQTPPKKQAKNSTGDQTAEIDKGSKMVLDEDICDVHSDTKED